MLRIVALIGTAAVLTSATQALGDSSGGVLRGHISDVETQQLLADADVRLEGDNGFTYRGHGDKHGFYLFLGVEPGMYKAEFSRPDYSTNMEYGIVVCPSGSTEFDTWLQSVHSHAIIDRFSLATVSLPMLLVAVVISLTLITRLR